MDTEKRGRHVFAIITSRDARKAGAAAALAAGLLACSGCVVPDEPLITSVNVTPVAGEPNCRDYTGRAVYLGTPYDFVGHACLQPDGSWLVTEGPPDRPTLFGPFIVPPLYAYGPYYDPSLYGPPYDPWYYGPPIGLGFGTVVFVDRFHHFHRFPFHSGFASGHFRDHFETGTAPHWSGHHQG